MTVGILIALALLVFRFRAKRPNNVADVLTDYVVLAACAATAALAVICINCGG